jgi:DNA processing protein
VNDDHRARLALALLPGITPLRADRLLAGRAPGEVVEVVAAGRLHDLVGTDHRFDRELAARWRAGVRPDRLDAALEVHDRLGIGVLSPLDPLWPLTHDPHPPFVLFFRGDLALLANRPRVAVVGTRRCTGVGRTVATRLGADLADREVTVVSGLALGIDAAAHRGALGRGGGVVAVVGSGLDVVYPSANRELWDRVADEGLLLSEFAVGAKPERWRFPARNRLLAGLSEAVVVVESHGRGGALSTAEEAADRGRPVLAVPGSVLSSASDGTNGLLVDGAIPVRSADDVAVWVDAGPPMAGPTSPDAESEDPPAVASADESPESSPAGAVADPPEPVDPVDRAILAEVATGPVHIDRLVLLTGASVPVVQVAVQRLVERGEVVVHGATVSSVDR